MCLRAALRYALYASTAPLQRCYHEGIGKRYTLAAQSGRDAARSPATGSLDIKVSSRSVAIITLIPWASKRSRARRGGGTRDSRARASGPAQFGAAYPIYRPRISGILRCHEIFVVRKANERPPPDATHAPGAGLRR